MRRRHTFASLVALAAVLLISCGRGDEAGSDRCASHTPILAPSDVDGRVLDRYVRRFNPDAPRLGDLFVDVAKDYGVDATIAFSQAFHETHAFTFGGDVSAAQNNYAGLGAIGEGASGASFASPREGIRAQIEHLYAYATSEALPVEGEPTDPRFDLVTRGSAESVEELAGKWAFPGYEEDEYGSLEEAIQSGDTYGHSIAYIARDIEGDAHRADCDQRVVGTIEEMLTEIDRKVPPDGS